MSIVAPINVDDFFFKLYEPKTIRLLTPHDIGYMAHPQAHVRIIENWHKRIFPNQADDRFGIWDTMIEQAKSYLIGDGTATNDFLAANTTRVIGWQGLALRWAWAHQEHELLIYAPRLHWHVNQRGEMVELRLPFHDHGGEKIWVSKWPFKSKVLVNVD